VASEGYELLSKGHVTFPRPEAATLLEIRSGKFPIDEILRMVESAIDKMEEAQKVSALPEEAKLGAS